MTGLLLRMITGGLGGGEVPVQLLSAYLDGGYAQAAKLGEKGMLAEPGRRPGVGGMAALALEAEHPDVADRTGLVIGDITADGLGLAEPLTDVAAIRRRQDAVRFHLQRIAPKAGGILVFSRLNIYYLTGTYGQGVLWLPLNDDPV
mgnify:CR=1 FL=1